MALVRTRDEAGVIGVFCSSYAWADGILVADGGSKDKTMNQARKRDKTQVREFKKRFHRGGLWANPQGEHVNFLLDWAKDEVADWVIFDDCDCHPNYKLRENARNFINLAEN